MLPRVLLQLPDLVAAEGLRWDVLVSALALVAIYLVFRTRGDLPRAMGFTRGDVALLTIGSVAAHVLSVPLFTVDETLFAVNLGGVLVPAILIWRLWRRGTLSIIAALLGAAVVAAATVPVVEVVPEQGAVVAFPLFLIPPAVALVYGLVAGMARPVRAGPLAFAAGSLGALIGADLLLLPEFLEVARTAPAGTALVIGGAGAFDLVFVSGALGLALSLLLGVLVGPGPAPAIGRRDAPVPRVPDPRGLLEEAQRLPGLTPRERCVVHLARANLALERQEGQRALEEAHTAVDALLQSGTPRLLDRVREHGGTWLLDEVKALHLAKGRAGHRAPPWHEACDEVERAKAIAGALWEETGGQVRLGVGA